MYFLGHLGLEDVNLLPQGINLLFQFTLQVLVHLQSNLLIDVEHFDGVFLVFVVESQTELFDKCVRF